MILCSAENKLWQFVFSYSNRCHLENLSTYVGMMVYHPIKAQTYMNSNLWGGFLQTLP